MIVAVEDERGAMRRQDAPQLYRLSAAITALKAMNARAESRMVPIREDAGFAIRIEILLQPGDLRRARGHIDHAVQ